MAYVLYDIPSKDRGVAWSPNTWRTRLILNYKGLDYKTRWIEYPDIASTLSPLQVLSKPGLHTLTASSVEENVRKIFSDMPYSVPAVQLPDGSYVMDSGNIAKRLEQDNPSPGLHLDHPIFDEVDQAVVKVKDALKGICMPKVPLNLLNETSKSYFEKTRAERFGKPLSQLAADEGGEEAWLAALPSIKALGELYKKNDGPFVLGKEVSYGDFVTLAYLQFVKTIEEADYLKVVKIEPVLSELYEASKQWLERDS